MKTTNRLVAATLCIALGVVALVTIPTAEAGGRNDNPRVLPLQSHSYGKTYGKPGLE